MIKKIKAHIESLKEEEKLALEHAEWHRSRRKWHIEDLLKERAKAYRLSIDKLQEILNEDGKSGGGTTEE